MELVTGRKGEAHVTSQQDRMLHQGVFGTEAYILNTGKKLKPEVQSSNEIRIRDGAIMVQGALSCVKINTYDSITIQNGTQGMKRIDLVVWQYVYNAENDTEYSEWNVIQGTPDEIEPHMPEYVRGDIQIGDNMVQVPYLAVHLDGINITEVEVLLEVVPDIYTTNKNLANSVDELNRKLIVSPSDIISFSPLVGQNYPNWGGCYYYTSGSRVHVHLGIQGLPANQVATVFVLPEAVHPKTRILSMGSSGSFPGVVRTEISLDGGINVTSQDSYAAAIIDYDIY